MVATGGFRQKTQLESLEQDLDVLIATPGRFIYLFQEGFLKLNNLKWYHILDIIQEFLSTYMLDIYSILSKKSCCGPSGCAIFV